MEYKEISKKRKLAKKDRLAKSIIKISKKKKNKKVLSLRTTEDAIDKLKVLANISNLTNGKEFERLINKEYKKIENNIDIMLDNFDNLDEKIIEI